MKFKQFFEETEALAKPAVHDYLKPIQGHDSKIKYDGRMNKFMGGSGTMFCGLCSGEVTPKEVKQNDKHHFNTGLWYQCNCGDCRFWGNSVRKPEDLKSYLGGKNNNAQIGFCYDHYCGWCEGHQTLQGVKGDLAWKGKRVTMMACSKCGKNNHLLKTTNYGSPSEFIKSYEKLMPNVQRGGTIFQAKRKLLGWDNEVGH